MRDFTIYIFKTKKKLDNPNIMVQSNTDALAEREVAATEFKKFIKKLKAIKDDEAYGLAFKKGVEKIAKLYYQPEKKLHLIGYDVTSENGNEQVVIKPVPIKTVEEHMELILENTFNKIEGQLDDMDFVYQLWRDKFIEGNGTIWLSKEELENAINMADKTIGNSYHPEEYLPQEDGEYNKFYFKDVRRFRNTCKHLLKLMEKKYSIYAIINQKVFKKS
jgi:hypothetical protein